MDVSPKAETLREAERGSNPLLRSFGPTVIEFRAGILAREVLFFEIIRSLAERWSVRAG